MIDEENQYRYISNLMPFVEGMVPLYEDAKLAQEELLDKNIAYRLLSSIPCNAS
ncbi:hypothetical protein acsn021_02540 [Anaerocolumna cellulosilytica]|uniref:Uncharacterized protein n=1 Tax=Anaerocolumna cellulosilytica TaxID=433286 RepID=A0A6S6QZ62_9FIRM|nr:hypothetical protein [Anaerocolumna cellulosilytica]MBB5196913.1 hypothetical protein [Anaerocolumna cellulosilytica]BCJ92685.1 hypothetical protein acsn021_02540 [Anaerocolumna cellulosilytica]